MRFGIDIDGTVTTPDAIIPFLNKDFGLSLTLNDIKDYDLSLLVDSSREEFSEWWLGIEPFVYAQSPLLEGVQNIMLEWSKKHELYFISARSTYLLSDTKHWFQQHGLPFHHIELIGSHDKIEAINKYQLEIFFEDKLDNSLSIHEQCQIPVILFDTPYNKGALPDGIIRVKNWQEAKTWVENWGNIKKA